MVLRRLAFEGKRRAVVETRVQSRGVVVVHVAPNGRAKLALVGEDDAARQLRLERMEERLHVRVVARPTGTGALSEAEPHHVPTETPPHVLGAAVAVKDDAAPPVPPAPPVPTASRCAEHGARDPGRPGACQTPREDPTRALVEDHGEIAPALAYFDERDVADPGLIRPRHGEPPQPVRMLRIKLMDSRLRAIAAHGFRAEAGGAHEAGDAMSAHAPALAPQRAMNPGTPVPLPMYREEPSDFDRQPTVLLRVCAHAAATPAIEAGPRHAVAPTQAGHAPPRGVCAAGRDERLNEGEGVTF